jgi:hypothetical protein
MADQPPVALTQDKALVAVAGLILSGIMAYSYYQYAPQRRGPSWNGGAITATYLGAQLREIDPSNATLSLSYELQNNTDSDHSIEDAPGFVVMSRLKADGSLSSQEEVRLGHSTFLPARQRAQVTLELRRQFDWPAAGDPGLLDKLKSFVNDGLASAEEFVLFDQSDHFQVDFPRGWQELKLAGTSN